MILKAKMIDGTVLVSDSVPLSDVLANVEAQLAAKQPVSRFYSSAKRQARENLEAVLDIWTSPAKANSLTMTVDGHQVGLNPRHVVFTEVDMEGEDAETFFAED